LENTGVGIQTISTVLAVNLIVYVVGVGAAAAQQPTPDNLFTAAGFAVKYADTPDKHAILRRLPPDKLVVRKRGGKTYYLYADPTICRCVYVGTPRAYQAYQTGSDGSQFLKSGDSSMDQVLDEFSEQDTAQPGTTSFDDYVFGGIQED
jgi:hypothetical protein